MATNTERIGGLLDQVKVETSPYIEGLEFNAYPQDSPYPINPLDIKGKFIIYIILNTWRSSSWIVRHRGYVYL